MDKMVLLHNIISSIFKERKEKENTMQTLIRQEEEILLRDKQIEALNEK